MAEDESDWIFEGIIQYLQSPVWKTPVLSFIDDNCIIFDNDEENKLEYTTSHTNFKSLVEKLFDQLIQELGLTDEQFLEACEKATKTSVHKRVVEQILAVDNFLAFKRLMMRRNKELDEEAMKILKNPERKVSGTKAKTEKKKEDPELAMATLKREEADIEAALAMSLAIEEERKKINEQEDLEMAEALRLSQMESRGEVVGGGIKIERGKREEVIDAPTKVQEPKRQIPIAEPTVVLGLGLGKKVPQVEPKRKEEAENKKKEEDKKQAPSPVRVPKVERKVERKEQQQIKEVKEVREIKETEIIQPGAGGAAKGSQVSGVRKLKEMAKTQASSQVKPPPSAPLIPASEFNPPVQPIKPKVPEKKPQTFELPPILEKKPTREIDFHTQSIENDLLREKAKDILMEKKIPNRSEREKAEEMKIPKEKFDDREKRLKHQRDLILAKKKEERMLELEEFEAMKKSELEFQKANKVSREIEDVSPEAKQKEAEEKKAKEQKKEKVKKPDLKIKMYANIKKAILQEKQERKAELEAKKNAELSQQIEEMKNIKHSKKEKEKELLHFQSQKEENRRKELEKLHQNIQGSDEIIDL